MPQGCSTHGRPLAKECNEPRVADEEDDEEGHENEANEETLIHLQGERGGPTEVHRTLHFDLTIIFYPNSDERALQVEIEHVWHTCP